MGSVPVEVFDAQIRKVEARIREYGLNPAVVRGRMALNLDSKKEPTKQQAELSE